MYVKCEVCYHQRLKEYTLVKTWLFFSNELKQICMKNHTQRESSII